MQHWVNANSTEMQCTVTVNTNSDVASLKNASIGYSVLGNVSDTHSLYTTDDGHMLPVQVDIPSDLGYTASSFSVKTTCKPLSKACAANPINGSYDCRTAGYDFAGAFTPGTGSFFRHTPFTLAFTDLALSGRVDCTGVSCWNQSNTALKGHFALAASIDFDFLQWENDPQAVPLASTTSNYFIIGCDYYAYGVTYNMVERAISSLTIKPLNLTTFSSFNFPLQAGLGNDFLKSQLTPLIARSTSVSGIASGFGSLFSQALLGLSAGALDERPVLAQQTRSSLLVAKIPKSLLWLNVAVPFAFAGLGMVILLWAILSHGGEGGKGVKERVNLSGLVAQGISLRALRVRRKWMSLLRRVSEQGRSRRLWRGWGGMGRGS